MLPRTERADTHREVLPLAQAANAVPLESSRLESSRLESLRVEVSASAIAPVSEPARTEEPTLAAALKKIAYDQIPDRFYQCLQLGIPAAFQLWSWHWHRTAGWMLLVSAFGAWALCEQKLRREAEAAPDERRSKVRQLALRVGRGVAGVVGGVLAAGLIGEAIVRMMSTVFHCPGCAG